MCAAPPTFVGITVQSSQQIAERVYDELNIHTHTAMSQAMYVRGCVVRSNAINCVRTCTQDNTPKTEADDDGGGGS